MSQTHPSPPHMTPFIDMAAATTAALAIWASSMLSSVIGAGVPPLLALTQSPETPPVSDAAFVRWAIEQGGLVLALLLVLYFYRKDFREADADRKVFSEYQQATTDRLMEIVESNTRAMQQLERAIDDAQNERFPPRARVKFNTPEGRQ